jgi:hypothetical protein
MDKPCAARMPSQEKGGKNEGIVPSIPSVDFGQPRYDE